MGLGVVGLALGGQPADGQLDPGLELGRAAGVQHDVVHAPVVGDDGEAALGDDQQHGYVGAGGADQPAQVAGVGEVLAAVDEDQVGVGRLEQGAALGGQDLDLVAEQGEAGEHLGRGLEGAGQQQQGAHGRASSAWADREGYRSMSTGSEHSATGETGPITVRYWAAARSAAGVAEPTGSRSPAPSRSAEVVRRAAALHPGTRLADVLAVCSVLVGDRPVGTADPGDVVVAPGSHGGVPAAVRGRLGDRPTCAGGR